MKGVARTRGDVFRGSVEDVEQFDARNSRRVDFWMWRKT